MTFGTIGLLVILLLFVLFATGLEIGLAMALADSSDSPPS